MLSVIIKKLNMGVQINLNLIRKIIRMIFLSKLQFKKINTKIKENQASILSNNYLKK
jgi:hypothetical protein